MAHQVLLTARARADLREIVSYISRDSPSRARRFAGELLDRALSLAQVPERGRAVGSRPGIRRLVQGSYLIYYRMEEEARIIRILRFWHGSRDLKAFRLED